MLYTESDLEESMEKIETINFHEVKEVAGIKFLVLPRWSRAGSGHVHDRNSRSQGTE